MKWTMNDGQAGLPGPATAVYPQGSPSVEVFRHGSLKLRYFVPQNQDKQQPHTQDEVYVVVSGQARFIRNADAWPVGPGDCLFVAAGDVHRFEGFSPDFKLWVMFYGPEGGEAP